MTHASTHVTLPSFFDLDPLRRFFSCMSDPFFQKKRKRSGETSARKGHAPPRRGDDADSDDAGLEAVEDMDLRHTFDEDEAQESETPAEAKVRLAKLYLEGLHEKEEIDGIDAAAVDRDNMPRVCAKTSKRAVGACTWLWPRVCRSQRRRTCCACGATAHA